MVAYLNVDNTEPATMGADQDYVEAVKQALLDMAEAGVPKEYTMEIALKIRLPDEEYDMTVYKKHRAYNKKFKQGK